MTTLVRKSIIIRFGEYNHTLESLHKTHIQSAAIQQQELVKISV